MVTAHGELILADVMPLLEQVLLDTTEARLHAEDRAVDDALRQAVFRADHRARELVQALRDIASREIRQ